MYSSAGDTATTQTEKDEMKINASRMIDTLEEVIATAGMMSKEQLENVVAGSAGWMFDHADDLSLEEMEKIDRLQDRILEKAA